MIENLIPTKQRVLARREDAEIMRGGIIIPETTRDKNQIATVVRVGLDVEEIKPGDKIMTKKFYGEGIAIAEDYFIIKEEDVLGYFR